MKPVQLDQIMKSVIIIKDLILERVGYSGSKTKPVAVLSRFKVDLPHHRHYFHGLPYDSFREYLENEYIFSKRCNNFVYTFYGRYALVRVSIPWI
jgi:hypothetical protein